MSALSARAIPVGVSAAVIVPALAAGSPSAGTAGSATLTEFRW